jgi:peptidoglycan/LPS O-acetylase OafA/YrhL
MARHSAGAHGAKSHKRADIEGLRAVAILAVVAYHCGLPVPGGYVGVDVFFVISGYLITSLLWKELSSDGHLSFAGFYARRARRLLPSAVLVIVVTVLVSIAVTGPLMATAVAKDAVACALYVGNYRFAFQATNYLSASGPVSPLQNYWSLGVEEQFYLLWPALLLVAFVLGRRLLGGGRGRHRRAAPAARPGPVLFVLAVVALLSFWSCVYLTHANQPWAFFSLPTRAWELALGGFLALAVREGRRLPASAAALLGWAGLAMIGWSLFAFNGQTVFPGPAALVPVAGTGLALVAGTRRMRFGPSGLLGVAPMRAIGTVSYTWYLWHWPVLILAPYMVGHPLDLAQRVGLGLFSLVLAAVTTVLVEQPLRGSAWLSADRVRSLLVGGAISLGAAALAIVVVAEVPPAVGTGSAAVASLSVAHDPPVSNSPSASAPASTSVPPAVAAADALNEQVNRQVYASLADPDVPSNLTPTLSDAASDLPVPETSGCLNGFTDAAVHPCVYGDTSSATSVVLFGDSHALQWFPAIDNIANQHNDALVVMTKATCPPIDITVFNPTLGRTYTECDKWKTAELTRMAVLHPSVVVLGFSREYGIPDDHVVVDGTAWLSGLREMITTIENSTGARVVLMGDDPYPQQNVPQCLSVNLSNTPACSIPKHYPYYNPGGIPQEQAIAAATGAGYIDTDSWFCISTTCTAIVGNLLVYRDDNHITASYADWLTPAIGAQFGIATGGAF